jgi:hypothetical protein
MSRNILNDNLQVSYSLNCEMISVPKNRVCNIHQNLFAFENILCYVSIAIMNDYYYIIVHKLCESQQDVFSNAYAIFRYAISFSCSHSILILK